MTQDEAAEDPNSQEEDSMRPGSMFAYFITVWARNLGYLLNCQDPWNSWRRLSYDSRRALSSASSRGSIPRCSVPRPRNWPQTLLARSCVHFGKDYVIKKLQEPVTACSLFSGVECARHAWAALSGAAQQMWGIDTGLTWAFTAALPLNDVWPRSARSRRTTSARVFSRASFRASACTETSLILWTLGANAMT